MEFTYHAYRMLLQALRENGYSFGNYHNWPEASRSVIMRHDIDESLTQAVRMAELENEEGVSATYFVLLRTDFYNVASRNGQAAMRRIQAMGHEIGLHYDEAAYEGRQSLQQTARNIIKECGLLSTLLETEASTVSMHRPSKVTIESDLQIPGIVNSYGKMFFRKFKYLSDSRRHWREPVMEIIRSGKYDHLHILTHAFWYHETEKDISETVSAFVRAAGRERYLALADNITDINLIIQEDEL